MLLAAILALQLAPIARAEESTRPDPSAVAAAAAEIESARRLYAQGRATEAQESLQSVLKLGPALSPEMRQRALAFLGDLLFSEEGARSAEPFFRALLDEDPDYVMDPLEHPPEVSRFFESLRAARPRPNLIAPPPPPREPPPWLALAPGGLHYFAHGNIGAGVAVATTQVALLVTNVVLFQQIGDITVVDPEKAADVQAYQQLELATNLTAGAFYVSLLLPPAVEFSRWGSDTSVTFGPGSVQVAGRF